MTRVLKALDHVSKSSWFVLGWVCGGALADVGARLDLDPADPTILWATMIVAAGIVVVWMVAWWFLVGRRRPW